MLCGQWLHWEKGGHTGRPPWPQGLFSSLSLYSPLSFESTTLNKPRKQSAISLGLYDLMPQNADCLLSLAQKQPQARPPEHECISPAKAPLADNPHMP